MRRSHGRSRPRSTRKSSPDRACSNTSSPLARVRTSSKSCCPVLRSMVFISPPSLLGQTARCVPCGPRQGSGRECSPVPGKTPGTSPASVPTARGVRSKLLPPSCLNVCIGLQKPLDSVADQLLLTGPVMIEVNVGTAREPDLKSRKETLPHGAWVDNPPFPRVPRP